MEKGNLLTSIVTPGLLEVPHSQEACTKEEKAGILRYVKNRVCVSLRCADRLIQIIRKLLRRDLFQEQLIKIGEQRLRRLR